MAENLVPQNKLKRARSITGKNVLELVRSSTDPLIVHCIIQGSDVEPYTVIIDTREKIVSHWCPDFVKAPSVAWCKHLGKTLLLLDAGELSKIASMRNAFSYRTSKQDVQQHLASCKERVVVAGDVTAQEASFTDMLAVARNLAGRDPSRCERLIPTLAMKMDEELAGASADLVPFTLLARASSIEAGDALVLAGLQGVTRKHLRRGMSRFVRSFWISATWARLEKGHALATVSAKFSISLDETGLEALEIPATASEAERHDAALVFSYMRDKGGGVTRTVKRLSLPGKIDKDRVRRALGENMVSGKGTRDIVAWLERKVEAMPVVLPSFENGDHFLIHVMNAMGDRPVHNYFTAFSGGRDFTFHSVKLLEEHPTLKWVFDRVKESEREYITRAEVHHHELFFTWLAGEDRRTSWRERPRAREVNPRASPGDFIVQWDVNVSRPHQEFLHSHHLGARLVMDLGSPLAPVTQPFDYTLCHASLVTRPDWTVVAKPKGTLAPDQVVELASRGVPVVSTLLPWDVLCNHARHEFIAAATVKQAISTCDRMKFVLGSIDLKKNLARLAVPGTGGLEQPAYHALHVKARQSTGRLNVETRALARKVLISEGNVLAELVGFLASRDDRKLKTVLDALIRHGSVAGFRNGIVSAVVDGAVKAGAIPRSLVSLAGRDDLGSYEVLPTYLAAALKQDLAKVQALLERKKPVSKALLAKNVVGKLIINECRVSPNGIADDKERDAMARLATSLARR